MTDSVIEQADRWGRELDVPDPSTLARTEQVLTAHEWTVYDTCACGWEQARGISHPAHVVQQLAAAGLLVAAAGRAGMSGPRVSWQGRSFLLGSPPRRFADGTS